MQKQLSLVIAIVGINLCAPAYSQASGPEQASKLYKEGQYAAAASAFEATLKSNPNDALSHYYLGLCYQQLRQYSSASSQYKWVATNAQKQDLKDLGAKALQQISSLSKPSNGASTEIAKSSGKPQILAFLCGCGSCKKLQVSLNSVQEQYQQKVEIMRLHKNIEMQEQYHVKGCPSVVILDKNGKEVYSKIGLMTETEMSDKVKYLL